MNRNGGSTCSGIYSLINISADKLEEAFTLEKKVYVSNYPWNRESAPIEENVFLRGIYILLAEQDQFHTVLLMD
jgi:hypothetical protein